MSGSFQFPVFYLECVPRSDYQGFRMPSLVSRAGCRRRSMTDVELGLSSGEAQLGVALLQPFKEAIEHLPVCAIFPHRFAAVRIDGLRENEGKAQSIAAPADDPRLNRYRIIEVFPGAICSL
jgi:hypothetical protein